MDRDYFGKGSSYTYISFRSHSGPLAGWVVASDDRLDLQPLSKVGERGFPLYGLPADVGGVARENRGRESTTVLCIRYETTHETTKTHSLAFLGSC